MRNKLKMLLGAAGVAAAMQAGAQMTMYPSTTPDVYPADRLYEARVVSSRAVSGAPEQRCWMERQQVGPLELPGVLIGGTIDLLTGKPQSTPYIQRCSTVTSTAYWDVTYDFNGVTHHAQLSTPPGNTITVNGFGDPRM
jgi:hypothetical protein